jgi:hypothetical protein
MTITEITFEEPDLVEGPIDTIIKNGVSVHFLRPSAIFRPSVRTTSSPYAVYNASPADLRYETGLVFQKGLIFEFSLPQRRVQVVAGLNERDAISGNDPTARLVAYDSSGREVSRDERILPTLPPTDGSSPTSGGPSPIETLLRVRSPVVQEGEGESGPLAGGDVITRVELIYSGFGREVIDNLEFECERIHPIVVSILGDVFFTQSGLFDASVPRPPRRLARKTSLFRVALRIHTDDGRPSFVDEAQVVLEGGPVVQFFSGQPRPTTGNQFAIPGTGNPDWFYSKHIPPITDNQQVYFFIPGRFLQPNYRYRFILRLLISNQIVYQRTLADSWSFQDIRGITMLLVPQHRDLDANYTRALMRVLEETARMFPVPDGIANLNSDDLGGIRFSVLPPVSYRDHTDPADPPAPGTTPIAYDQGFLLRDHNVIPNAGADMVYGTDLFGTNDDPPPILWRGEFLPINFVRPEDENRDGMFNTQELARVVDPPGGGKTPIYQRYSNWWVFASERVESARVDWNMNHHSRASRRAIIIVTSSEGIMTDNSAQNRTGLEGGADTGLTTFWASLSIAEGGFIPHETGHTYGFAFTLNRHTDSPSGTPGPSCEFPGEAINLLTRQIVNPGSALMCSEVGTSSNLFLNPAEYNTLFDRLVRMARLE